MRKVFVRSDNIITSLGFTTRENAEALAKGKTGIALHEDERLSPVPFWASLVDNKQLSERFSVYADPRDFSRFEQMVICSAREAISHCSVDLSAKRTLFILSTTKGNVELLDRKSGIPGTEENRVYLWHTASLLKQFFKLNHTPLVVSNACISGVLSIMIGARYIQAGEVDHVIITGADLVTEFVLSGFNSFLSLCNGPCKPFDKDRQGLSLGEGAGTVILSADQPLEPDRKKIIVGPGFSSNDANHISGPSRTGEGLYLAIVRTLGTMDDPSKETGHPLDFISAHGTATPYNDEMESIAIARAGLQHIPVNSFKGYWGHTLGAAGVVESVAGIYSMQHNLLFGTLGFQTPGVTQPIHVIRETKESQADAFLKIASGFGGCNAALLFCTS